MTESLDFREMYQLINDYFGSKIAVDSVSETTGELTFVLYEAFVFKCGVDSRYRTFGLALLLGEHTAIRSFLGKEISMKNNEESIRQSLIAIDEYCRLRLPDKYLDAYTISHNS